MECEIKKRMQSVVLWREDGGRRGRRGAQADEKRGD